MIDIKLLRNNPEYIKTALINRNYKHTDGESLPASHILNKQTELQATTENPIANKESAIYIVDEIFALDAEVRKKQLLSQNKVAERNKIAKEIGILKSQQKNVDKLLNKVSESKTEEEKLVHETKALEEELSRKLLYLPNIPQADIPLGLNESNNSEIRTWGAKPNFTFQPKEHYELGTNLGMMDFQKAAQVAGSRFVYLKSQLAKLERALGSFMLDVHTKKFGYQEYSVPVLMNPQAFVNTAQLPKFQEDLFSTSLNKYLISTGEIPLTNLAMNEIFTPEELPMRLTSLSLCFRAEAGAAGKDTKGMLRQHQFSKVELVSICEPSRSNEELEYMVNAAEEILKLLEIPYRVMLLCTGDMGFSSTKTYDIEAWLPAQNKYREISSCSNCEDFQARRMNAKIKGLPKGSNFVHTLNGSGLAVGRTLIAVLENYQQADGSILIPKVLQPYMDNKEVIK
ncbi:Serine--tRNA ligase [Candidatus Hepatincola sp. Av]